MHTGHVTINDEIRARMTLCMCEKCRLKRVGDFEDADLIGLVENVLEELASRGYKFTDDDHDEQLYRRRNGRLQ